MSKYEFFSPSEVLQTYFNEFAGNIQNKSHSKSLKYYRKIEKLREYFADFLGIKDTHFISFQFNNYYINRLIFSYLKMDSSWAIYSDDLGLASQFPKKEVYPLNFLFNLPPEKSKTKKLIWMNNLKNINLELFEATSRLIKEQENSCYVFLSLDYVLYSSDKISFLLKESSFLVFNPGAIFQEYGIVFFAFNKKFKLEPIFMGSGAAKFNRETKNIEIQKLPHSLEIGTQNFISLIILERVFYFLSTEKERILPRIKNQLLNFNLSENLLPT